LGSFFGCVLPYGPRQSGLDESGPGLGASSPFLFIGEARTFEDHLDRVTSATATTLAMSARTGLSWPSFSCPRSSTMSISVAPPDGESGLVRLGIHVGPTCYSTACFPDEEI
jgi:hypothetical protein